MAGDRLAFTLAPDGTLHLESTNAAGQIGITRDLPPSHWVPLVQGLGVALSPALVAGATITPGVAGATPPAPPPSPHFQGAPTVEDAEPQEEED